MQFSIFQIHCSLSNKLHIKLWKKTDILQKVGLLVLTAAINNLPDTVLEIGIVLLYTMAAICLNYH